MLEPFSNNFHQSTLYLNIDQAIHHTNGKIWILWTKETDCQVLDMSDQHISCELSHIMAPQKFIVTYIMQNARIALEDICGSRC